MDKTNLLAAIKQAKEQKGERKFKQSIDLAINLKEFDLKKDSVDEYLVLPNGRGRPATVCALVGAEMTGASKLADAAVMEDQFVAYKTPRQIRKLARKYDFFVGQANLMPLIAKTFGRYFSPAGKMPNPKAGQIVSPKANIEPIVANLRKTIRLQNKKSPVLHCTVGIEDMEDEKLAQNILFILDRLNTKLPRGKHNIANLVMKTTMGKGVKVE